MIIPHVLTVFFYYFVRELSDQNRITFVELGDPAWAADYVVLVYIIIIHKLHCQITNAVI